jgi:hypothetical protein
MRIARTMPAAPRRTATFATGGMPGRRLDLVRRHPPRGRRPPATNQSAAASPRPAARVAGARFGCGGSIRFARKLTDRMVLRTGPAAGPSSRGRVPAGLR